jgi:outer membrane protein
VKDESYQTRGLRQILLCSAFAVLAWTTVEAQDVFNTMKAVPFTAASPLISDTLIPFGPPARPLILQDAIERALYNNPKTREQWANIKVQAAGVGAGYSAYLPTLTGSLQGSREVSTTEVNGFPQLNSDTWANTDTESISLSWVLYDFGGRDGALKNAKELLLAAQANHEATLRDVFAAVTKDYYAAQAAQGTVETAVENETTAKESYTAAAQRVEKGVSPISDQLQADTAYLQAEVDLTKARGDSRIATGTLASDMGLRPDEPIILPKVDVGVQPDKAFQTSISALIDDAINHHPTVQMAEAQLLAAEGKVKQIRAQGLPTLSLVAKSNRSDEPLNEEVGVSSFKATETDSYVGAQVNIPLFDGFSNDYQIRQAQAQVEVQRYTLEDAKRQVGLDVWTSYQSMQEAAQNLGNNAQLLNIAQKSYVAAQDRYENGVGTMIERLNAQSTLASAKLQWVKALTDWRTSRLQLASKLGTMGPWWVNGK